MTKPTLSLAILLAISSHTAQAENQPDNYSNSYQHEAEVSFLESDFTSDGIINASYEFHFKPLEANNKPLVLGSFFNQSSSLSFGYSNTDIITSYQASGEYVFDSKWFVGGSYQRINQENNWVSPDSEDAWSLSAGKYLNDNTLIAINFTQNSNDEHEIGNNHESKFDYTNRLYSAHYLQFFPLESTAGIFLNATYGYSTYKSDSYNDYPFYYDEQQRYKSYSTNDSKTHLFIAKADWFITNAWSVGIAANYINNEYTYVSNRNIVMEDNTLGPMVESRSKFDATTFEYGIGTQYFWQFSRYFSLKAKIEQLWQERDVDRPQGYSYSESDDELSIGLAVNARF
ncbi:hypothetical protein G3R49_17200 [Shewanella sp. WXL01]|uniref:hypothetical protein n=1 Tax=Shewanella sp. WXL01 TaxID=2709721 RepID=UPI0014382557|nr:hypothetical protein [Shewanella sp. WXL01]NKF52299.1 hypothetical protein [Shewanella sp. WXL01]